MRWRHRRGRRRKPIRIFGNYDLYQVIPVPIKDNNPIILSKEELEVLKLVDLEGKTQEEASIILGCSRAKVSRILNEARKKLVQSLVEGRPIRVE